MGYGHQRDQNYDRIFARDKDEMTVLDIGIIAKPEQWNENKTRKNGDPKMFGRGLKYEYKIKLFVHSIFENVTH